MSRARSNKENRPKRPSTLGLLLGGTGGRKDASKGAEAERQRRRRERDVSVNIFFTIFTNAFSPIAPTRMRRFRRLGAILLPVLTAD